MFDERMNVLHRLMDVALQRQQVHAGNLANQNTPGYKARAVAFEEAFNQALDAHGLQAAAVVRPIVYEPRSSPVDLDGNDVSSEREISAMAKNKLLYDSYVALARGKLGLLNTAITSAPGG